VAGSLEEVEYNGHEYYLDVTLSMEETPEPARCDCGQAATSKWCIIEVAAIFTDPDGYHEIQPGPYYNAIVATARRLLERFFCHNCFEEEDRERVFAEQDRTSAEIFSKLE